MRKSGELALKTLEFIAATTVATAAVVQAILESPYGSSSSRIERRAREIEERGNKEIEPGRQKQRLYELLHRLHQDGLINKKEGRKNLWSVTKKGYAYLLDLKKHHKNRLPKREYAHKEADGLKIIAFDIPERHRHKRNWLRNTLEQFGFTMLQKSVWAGKRKLPEEFIKDLAMLSILPYVEILSVTKTGSLRPFLVK